MMSTIKASSVAQNLSSIASTAVNKFNQAYDALLKQFGRYKSTGNVKGRITDKKGIGIANMLVSFGGKYATTDKNGDYSISNLQPGATQIYSVKDSIPKKSTALLTLKELP